MGPGVRLLTVLLALAMGWGSKAQDTPHFERIQDLDPGFPAAAWRLVDLEGDGHDELLVVGRDGAVRVWPGSGDARSPLAALPVGSLVLPDPAHALLELARLTGPEGPLFLVVADPAGVRAWEPRAGGGFEGEGYLLTPAKGRGRTAFRLRTGVPVFAPLCQDVNGDGRPDVIIPVGESVELWVNGAVAQEGEDGAVPDGAPIRLRRAARLSVQVRRESTEDGSAISDVWESTFTIPRLTTQDVNGDGRQDVVVEAGGRHSWHLQTKDGTIPQEPDISLDLGIFRDTTPQSSIRPGRTLAGGDRQRMQSRDLDRDGIPDYVIAHRRKVWVFHGSEAGPQFTKPTQIVKSLDDVTALLLLNLDEDGFPDLVLIKVQVPTVATLLLGTLGEFEVEVDALGYRSEAGRAFEVQPVWRSSLTVRLPSIVKILRNPYAIIRRFEEVGERFVGTSEADLDGDGKPEVLQTDPQVGTLRIWLGRDNPKAPENQGSDAILRDVLFGEVEQAWNIDRLVEWMGRLADEDVTRRTGGRAPDLTLDLPKAAEGLFDGYAAGRFGRDGSPVLVLATRPADNVRTLRLSIHRLVVP